ncbi:MAG: hypothetical protein AB2809_15905 [Candidatus Thiodiazotropha sp.]
MKYLIVEDQKATIELWLDSLKASEAVKEPKEPVRIEAANMRSLDWFNILRAAKASTRTETWPQLATGLRYLTTDSAAAGSEFFGIAGEHLIVLLVVRHTAASYVASWLESNMPDRCLSFLDYELAGDTSAKIAERIAPLLARSPVQLCVNHSSVIRTLDDVPFNLGLDASRSQFYSPLYARLANDKEAKNCLKEALEFWDKWNSKFTGVDAIDRILNWYILFKTDTHDGPNFWHHDDFDTPSSPIRKFLDSQGFLTVDDGDALKGLFRCNSNAGRLNDYKQVSQEVLRHALSLLELDEVTFENDDGPKWNPPFLPGVLFLCQLRRMHDSFADTKAGRSAPRLAIRKNSAVFTFDVNIERELSDKPYAWRAPRAGSKSCSAMRAMMQASIDEADEKWKSDTSASMIPELINGSDETIDVNPKGNCLLISWGSDRARKFNDD